MKSHRRRKSMVWLSLIMVLNLIAATSVTCERAAPIRVVNQTDQTLTIFIIKQKIGEVSPGGEIKNQNRLAPVAGIREFLIEAKNAQGDTLYSRSFTYDQLSRDMGWKVVIPPLEKV